MNGVVFGDANGIAFTGGGTLVVENSVIAGFGLGGSGAGIRQLAPGSNLIVNNCELRNNTAGVWNDTGSDTNSDAVVENSRFESNADGFDANDGAANVSIRNSVFTNNGNAMDAFSSLQTRLVLIVVDTCTMAHNSTGTAAGTSGAGSATIRVTNSTIYHNGTGMFRQGSGAIESYGNNRVLANSNSSTFSGTVSLQ